MILLLLRCTCQHLLPDSPFFGQFPCTITPELHHILYTNAYNNSGLSTRLAVSPLLLPLILSPEDQDGGDADHPHYAEPEQFIEHHFPWSS